MSKKLKIEKTGRGFAIANFRDSKGVQCSIQKSSLATADAIWLGVDDADPRVLASVAGVINPDTGDMTGWVQHPFPDGVVFTTRMHLTRDGVKKLLPLLRRFVKTGDLAAKSTASEGGDE